MNKKPGIVLDNRLLRHAIARMSPENPDRLRKLYRILDDPQCRSRFLNIPSKTAGTEDVEAVHSRFYLDQVRDHSLSEDPYSYDRDTYLMTDTLDCAYLAAGSCIQMADAIMSGETDRGFALVRPPGHHAEPGRGMGFCVLNNAAITASWLNRVYGLNRILIFDFDVHHGNGTQEAFYTSDQVLFCSIHENALFPFSGSVNELGEDRGLGFTVNIPVYPGYGDAEYTYLTGQVLQALAEQYMPQFIIVSSGFDGHEADPISKVRLSTEWYGTVTRLIRRLAQDYGESRVLMILEGGYNPESLYDSVLSVLKALDPPKIGRVGIPPSDRALRLIANHPAREFWTF